MTDSRFRMLLPLAALALGSLLGCSGAGDAPVETRLVYYAMPG